MINAKSSQSAQNPNSEKQRYAVMTFKTREDFEMYSKVVKLTAENLGVPLGDGAVSVLVKTDILMPSGILIAKSTDGRDIQIKITTGYTMPYE